MNAANWRGMTPLDVAYFGKSKRRKGNFDAVIALLIERGGRTNAVHDNLAGIATRRRFTRCV